MPPAGAHCTFKLRPPPSCQCSISSRCAPAPSSTVRATVCMPSAGLRSRMAVAVHSNDDAVVRSSVEVNASRLAARSTRLASEPGSSGSTRFPSSMNPRSTAVMRSSMIGTVAASTWIPIAAGEPGYQAPDRAAANQSNVSETAPSQYQEPAAERAGVPAVPDSRERRRHQTLHARSGASVVAGRVSLAGR